MELSEKRVILIIIRLNHGIFCRGLKVLRLNGDVMSTVSNVIHAVGINFRFFNLKKKKKNIWLVVIFVQKHK